MEFQIVGHACLSVSAGGKRLVIDPWIRGPVYWSSWWHWPDPVYGPELLAPDFIYLTHWHFDHFHADSLRLFNKAAHVLVARFPVSSLASQLRALGFTTITELRQAERFPLATGFSLTSYQVRHEDDSVAVIDADGTCLVDLNDAKPMPSTWKILRARHPQVDFMLRSHSPAWSYPTFYSFEDRTDAIEVSSRTYIEAFIAAARMLRPRHAVPFASGVCHLHRDVREANADIVTTAALAAVWNEEPRGRTELTVMPPGTRWSTSGGFEIAAAPDEPAVFLARLERREHDRLEALYRAEQGQECSFDAFREFFEDFFRRARLLAPRLGVHWVFEVAQPGGTEFWSVDFRRRVVRRLVEAPAEYTSLITVHPSVLDEAVREMTFTNIDISKRWRVRVRRGGLIAHHVAIIFVMLYEAGYLRPRNLLTRRCLSGAWRRRWELVDYAKLGLRLLRRDRAALARINDPA